MEDLLKEFSKLKFHFEPVIIDLGLECSARMILNCWIRY